MREEEIVVRALKNEQARLETMRIVEKIRDMGGVGIILRMAGYILAAPPAETKLDGAA